MLVAGLIGIAIGLVLGMTGAGGSVIAVPLLIGGLGYGFNTAAGASLGAVALSALTGVLLRWHASKAMWRLVAVLALGGVLFSPLGQWLARQLSQEILLTSFALLMLYMAWRLWQQATEHPEEARIVRASVNAEQVTNLACNFSSTGNFEWRWLCVSRLLLVGAFSGLLTGLYGVGGGFVIVPLLILFTGLAMAQAVAVSLAVITLVAGSTFLWFISAYPLSDSFMGVAAGAIAGMLAGSVLAQRLAGPKLQKIFAALMVVLAIYMVIKSYLVGA